MNHPANSKQSSSEKGTLYQAVSSAKIMQVGRSGRVFTAVLFVLFLLFLLVSLWMGISVYSKLHDMRNQTTQERLSLNLIANSVRANDEVNAVGVGEGPEGKALVLTQRLDTGTYETRFYLYKGNLVMEFVLGGAAYTPESATVVTPTNYFDFECKGRLLQVHTDQGQVEVALRSVGE